MAEIVGESWVYLRRASEVLRRAAEDEEATLIEASNLIVDRRSSALERRTGLAAELLETHPMRSVLIVASNSGGNAVSLELAVLARQRGVLVIIALTSLNHARSQHGRPGTDSRLHEQVDIVLDNHGAPADACIPVPGSDAVVGPTSTVVDAALLARYRPHIRAL